MRVEESFVELHEVSAVYEGKIYRGHYYVKGGELIVQAPSTKNTIARNQVMLGEAATPDVLARLLLTEMIYAGRVVAPEA